MASTTKTPAARTAFRLSDLELRQSAKRRLESLADRYGPDSPQVQRALARWGAIEKSRETADDLTAILDALADEMTAVLDAVRAQPTPARLTFR